MVTDKQIREKLKPVSWNQSQITDASHLFVFCNDTEAKPEYIDDFIKRTANERNWDSDRLNGYGDFINSLM